MQNLETSTNIEYDAFISYSHNDKKFAWALKKKLERHQKADGKPLKVFLDEANAEGTELTQALENTLRSSRQMILLCSPHSYQSKYVEKEVRFFIKVKGAKQILPVLVGGLPNNEAEAKKQPSLKSFPEPLCQGGYDPFALEYRNIDVDQKNDHELDEELEKGRYSRSWERLLGSLTKENPRAWDVFICNAKADRNFAERFETELEAYRPPKPLKLPQSALRVFWAETKARRANAEQEIDEALLNARKFVLICSPSARSTKEPLISQQLQRFAHNHGVENIIHILLEGKPNHEILQGEDELKAIPDVVYGWLTEPATLNYVGAKQSNKSLKKDPYRDAWITAVANIYNVNRDVFSQKELERTKQWWKRASMAAFGILFLVSGLAAFAYVQKVEAEKATRSANEQLDAAEAAKKEALRQKEIAEQQKGIADEERRKAEEQRQEAERQKGIADERRIEAEMQQQEAERQKGIANEQRIKAETQTEIAKGERDKAQFQQCIAEEQRARANEQAELARTNQQKAQSEEKKAKEALQRETAVRKAEKLGSQVDMAKLSKYQSPIMSAVLATSAIMALPELRKNLQENGQSDQRPDDEMLNDIFKSSLDTLQQSLPLTLLSHTIETEGAEKAVFTSENQLITISANGKGQILQYEGLNKVNGQMPVWPRADDRSVISKKIKSSPFVLTANLRERKTDERAEIKTVAISPQGTYVAIGQDDGYIKFGKLCPSCSSVDKVTEEKSIETHEHVVANLAFNMQTENPLLATSTVFWRSSLSSVGKPDSPLWKKPSGFYKLLDGFFGTKRVKLVTAIAFDPENKWLALGREDGAVELRDVEKGTLRRYWLAHDRAVTGLAFNPSKKGTQQLELVTVSEDKKVKLWEINDPKFRTYPWYTFYSLIGTENHPANAAGTENEKLPACPWWQEELDALSGVAFSSDGKLLATVGQDRRLTIWNMEKRNSILSLRAHDGGISQVSFSPHLKPYQIVTVSAVDNTIRLWEIPSVEELGTLQALQQKLKNQNEDSFLKKSYRHLVTYFLSPNSSPKLSKPLCEGMENPLIKNKCEELRTSPK